MNLTEKMNLTKLFEAQKVLDEHIERDHPKKEGEDRLSKKILALQSELGELANEWKGFKFWSNDQEPRTNVEVFCKECQGTGTPVGIPEESGVDCWKCDGCGSYFKNPLLEEYVDCLHFILSIGLEDAERYGAMIPIYIQFNSSEPIKYDNITKHFNYMFNQIGYFMDCCFDREWGTDNEIEEQYEFLFRMFLGLGEMLGFTREEIEDAYFAKNKINHKRQENGY